MSNRGGINRGGISGNINRRNNYNRNQEYGPAVTDRDTIRIGSDVMVVMKEDQASGAETAGTVKTILTNSSFHPRGIKVLLTSGDVGRVVRFAGHGPAAAGPDETGCLRALRESSEGEGFGEYTANRKMNLCDYITAQIPVEVAVSPPRKEYFSCTVTPDVNDEMMASLVAMDFEPKKVHGALIRSGNNFDSALNFLLEESA